LVVGVGICLVSLDKRQAAKAKPEFLKELHEVFNFMIRIKSFR
jgi:hypothetical protein